METEVAVPGMRNCRADCVESAAANIKCRAGDGEPALLPSPSVSSLPSPSPLCWRRCCGKDLALVTEEGGEAEPEPQGGAGGRTKSKRDVGFSLRKVGVYE